MNTSFLPQLNLRLLTYFVVFAQEPQIRDAANRLGITPQALLFGLRTLQQQLGTLLFLPGKPQELTAEGAFLHQQALLILGEVENLLKSHDPPQALRIGYSSETVGHILQQALLHEDWPHGHMPIKLYALPTAEIQRWLQLNQLDLSLELSSLPGQAVQHPAYNVSSLEYCLVSGSPGPWQNQRYVCPPSSGRSNQVSWLDPWNEDLYPRQVAFETPCVQQALSLCQAHGWASCVPRAEAQPWLQNHLLQETPSPLPALGAQLWMSPHPQLSPAQCAETTRLLQAAVEAWSQAA
ncbi:MAG: LysR family transcriptional regulator [Candidatus Sericytochromatia bacterium]